MPAFAAVVGCSGVATASSSPTPSAYAARELPYLETLNRSNQFSGSALVAIDGHVVLRTAVGSADVQHQIPNRPDTRFRIGSITKAFTATAVMMLVRDGRLKLADSPCQYVEPCPDAWKSVTARNLLTHTSGIPDYLRPITLAQFDAPTPPGDLLALVSDRPLLFQPGSSYAYSNANYVLLGLIIERLSGISYAAFLKRRIFGPLGMGSSGYERDFGRVPEHATGYGYKTTSCVASRTRRDRNSYLIRRSRTSSSSAALGVAYQASPSSQVLKLIGCGKPFPSAYFQGTLGGPASAYFQGTF